MRSEDVPLVIEGRYSGEIDFHVWVALEDSYGNYYLQNPEIRFLPDGVWTATNVLPGGGISFVHFVRVDDLAHANFHSMVARKEWGGFAEMPSGCQTLVTIRITLV